MPDALPPRRWAPESSRVPQWAAVAAVAAGGLVGSGARAVVATAVSAAPDTFPVATLTVNLVGSLLLGLYLARRQRAVVGRLSLPFWAIGVLGSFTTFSAFSFEVFRLVEEGRVPIAVWYVMASMLGGLVAAALGDRIGGSTR